MKEGLWFTAVAVGIFSLFLLVPGGTSQWLRYDNPTPDMVVGYLTMSGGTKRISWQADAPTDDPGGPEPDAVQDALLAANWIAYATAKEIYVGHSEFVSAVPQPAADEFVGDPLPKTLHLDPARPIHLELFINSYGDVGDPCYSFSGDDPVNENLGLTYGPDPWLAIELLVDDRLLGGQIEAHYIDWWQLNEDGGYDEPENPPGYSTCRFQFHPEAITLEAGSVLKLRITHVVQSRMFQYGLEGAHHSVLRFATFSEEEWLFRDPALAAGLPARAPPLSNPSVAMSGLALSFLGPAHRRRSLVLAVLVVSAFAGCVAPSGPDGLPTSPGPQGGIENTFVPDADRSLTSDGTGGIVGRVQDSYNNPLEGVHVSIFQTNTFGKTDGSGLFTFRNVTPGARLLRFDFEEFQSFETDVEVRAGFVSRPEITLYPIVIKFGDDAWHPHDYWAGKDAVTLLDGDVPAVCGEGGCYGPGDFEIPGPTQPGEYRSVLPGTYDLEITFSWTEGEIRDERLGLGIRHAGETSGYNITPLFPRGPNEPFHVAVGWETDDPGHQVFSSWGFRALAAPQDYTSDNPPTPPPTGEPPRVHVKIVAHRGVVPLEPAHPDWWEGKNELKVLAAGQDAYHDPLTFALSALCRSNVDTANVQFQCGLGVEFGAPDRLVPADTAWIEVFLNRSRDPTVDYALELLHRTAAMPENTPWAAWKNRGTGTAAGDSMVWRFAAEAGDADPPYSVESAWSFFLHATDEDAFFMDGADFANGDISYTLTVIAHRTGAP